MVLQVPLDPLVWVKLRAVTRKPVDLEVGVFPPERPGFVRMMRPAPVPDYQDGSPATAPEELVDPVNQSRLEGTSVRKVHVRLQFTTSSQVASMILWEMASFRR